MSFRAKLFRIPGPGGWVFAPVPARHAPPVTEGWGRTPVRAIVDGVAWDTSVWRDRKRGTLLAVPARVRGAKDDGDTVTVEIHPRGAVAAGAGALVAAATARSRPRTTASRRQPRRGASRK